MSGFSMTLTAVTAFGVTVLLGIILIPYLKKLKFGQTIREDGPTWHQAKQGTPTMGGLMFFFGITAAALAGFFWCAANEPGLISKTETIRLFAGLAMAIAFGGIGFIDDYIKVVKKRNLGLTAKQKILLQILVTAAFLTVMGIWGADSGESMTALKLPFIGSVELSYFYYPIMGLFIIFFVNAVNLTDGIDGLCTSVTFVVAVFFILATGFFAMPGMNVLALALGAGCVGFLVFNAYPARVFMGDTGSFFLGGVVLALGFGTKNEFLLLLTGFVYCFEALSVILQVISFKTTGKRIFKMSPIHHHFEMSGWKETKIVSVFSGVALITSVIAFIFFK